LKYLIYVINVVFYPIWSNLNELINKKNIFIYTLSYKQSVIAIYIYKETNCIEFEGKTIECISCAMLNENKEAFVFGFNDTICDISKTYTNILIHNISDTTIALDVIKKKHKEKYIINTHLFLYNYIHKNVHNNDCITIY